MLRDPWGEVENDLKEIRLRTEEKLGIEHLSIPLEIPPEGLGDICFPAFQYSSIMSAPPEECAQRLASEMGTGKYFEKHEAVKGFVNSLIDYGRLTPEVIESVLSLGSEFGSLESRDERILLEHTSVNPTGPIHIGRSRNSIIGDTLARVMRRAGYDVTTEFLVNDTGKQMVILTWATQNITEEDLQKPRGDKEDHLLVRYYQKAYEILESDPDLERTIEELVLELDRGEEEMVHAVKTVAERVMKGMVSTLEEIGVSLDSFFWESSTILDGTVHDVIEALKASENARSDEGAYYLDLENHGIHGWDSRFFFTRKDGTSLYTTRDIAYHLGKFERCDSQETGDGVLRLRIPARGEDVNAERHDGAPGRPHRRVEDQGRGGGQEEKTGASSRADEVHRELRRNGSRALQHPEGPAREEDSVQVGGGPEFRGEQRSFHTVLPRSSVQHHQEGSRKDGG
jgi:arginyl-tRNA synthetase